MYISVDNSNFDTMTRFWSEKAERGSWVLSKIGFSLKLNWQINISYTRYKYSILCGTTPYKESQTLMRISFTLLTPSSMNQLIVLSQNFFFFISSDLSSQQCEIVVLSSPSAFSYHYKWFLNTPVIQINQLHGPNL